MIRLKFSKFPRLRALETKRAALGAALAVLVLTSGLFIQHLRHGWPFSLHHGLGGPESPTRRATSEGTTAVAHPRVEVQLDRTQIEALGIRVAQVRRETFSRPVRSVATVVPDEARVSHVHSRVSGWIERLYVSTTGEQVRAGQPLAGIFSQELLSTQNEYLAVRRASLAGPRSMVLEGARARLGVLGMTNAEIEALDASGEARRLVTIVAPRAGVVLNRGISVGTAIDPSTEIVTVADLTRVWGMAEVTEADIPAIQVGTPALLEFPASGRESFEASVQFLYPTLSERTRTLRVRFELDNSKGGLRPGIYGTATFRIAPRSALTIPRDAVVDTGGGQHVFVVSPDDRYVPRSVKLGVTLGDRAEVRDGLQEGETVVASGVFLIDSESRLRASGGGIGHAHGQSSAGASPARERPSPDGHQPPARSANHQGH